MRKVCSRVQYESELDVDEDNVCKQSRREGNTYYKRSYTKYILYIESTSTYHIRVLQNLQEL